MPAFPRRTCAWCNSVAHIQQGHILLCKKHYRFQTMCVNAKRQNKKVPSYEYLEHLYKQNKNMICSGCKNKMSWLVKESKKHVITLHHENHNGRIMFLCRSCNSIQSNHTLDQFKLSQEGKKQCRKCGKIYPLHYFFADKRIVLTGKKSYCKLCANEYLRNWQNNNREHYNGLQREWRRKHKVAS